MEESKTMSPELQKIHAAIDEMETEVESEEKPPP